MSMRPIIGCTSYHKVVTRDPYLEVFGLSIRYKEALMAAGAIPVAIPSGLDQDGLVAVLERVDGILLPGGGDIHPRRYNGQHIHATVAGIDEERDETEIFVAREAVTRGLPLLAICRGHQLLNVVLGGTLWQDVVDEMPQAMVHDYHRPGLGYDALVHTVDLKPGSQLAHLLGRQHCQVNSLHHQGVRDLAPVLAATAVAPDGLVEGVEVIGHPFAIGVQWHPEQIVKNAPAMLALFQGLTAAAGQRSA